MSLIPLPSGGSPPIKKSLCRWILLEHSDLDPAELGCSGKQHGLNRFISVVEMATNKANSRECR
ncbi:hypothetical protein YC2023_110058 [Brassica napus]